MLHKSHVTQKHKTQTEKPPKNNNIKLSEFPVRINGVTLSSQQNLTLQDPTGSSITTMGGAFFAFLI